MFFPSPQLFSWFAIIYGLLFLFSSILLILALYLLFSQVLFTAKQYKIVLALQMLAAFECDVLVTLMRPFGLVSAQTVLVQTSLFNSIGSCLFLLGLYLFHLLLCGIFFISPLFCYNSINRWLTMYNDKACIDGVLVCQLTGLPCGENPPYMVHCDFNSAQRATLNTSKIVTAFYLSSTFFLAAAIVYDAFHPKSYMSERTKEMHRYFNTIFFLQLLTFIISIGIPFFFLILIVLKSVQGDIFEIVADMFPLWVSFHSLFTSSIVIFASKSNRRLIVTWWKSTFGPINTIHIIPRHCTPGNVEPAGQQSEESVRRESLATRTEMIVRRATQD
ncbi:unnamed protein product, partial [Mesorhabditis belari]|uniref:Uncharacterized protein n=1 Tax=Mesorhabditis belari TaxID=2138241 RepID=A0AAF3ES10_9BILA